MFHWRSGRHSWTSDHPPFDNPILCSSCPSIDLFHFSSLLTKKTNGSQMSNYRRRGTRSRSRIWELNYKFCIFKLKYEYISNYFNLLSISCGYVSCMNYENSSVDWECREQLALQNYRNEKKSSAEIRNVIACFSFLASGNPSEKCPHLGFRSPVGIPVRLLPSP